jgi:hypothetical protein
MKYPPPRRSKFSNYYLNNNLVDYNLMAPLNSAPYSFPCKGYIKGPSTAQVTGSNVNIQLDGTAVHGGGHCQFGISYDDTNFLVLKTVVGSCLIDSMSYEMQLPDGTPPGQMTVFWTWINRIGNREYYMDCADVTVTNGGNQNGVATLFGKELLIVNLPGYQEIPEFPNPGMYGGEDLLDARKDTYITVTGGTENEVSQTPTTTSSPTSSPSQQPPENDKPGTRTASKRPKKTPKRKQPSTGCLDQKHTGVSELSCQTNGALRCAGLYFETCDHNRWISRMCSPGTKCKQFDDTIACVTN